MNIAIIESKENLKEVMENYLSAGTRFLSTSAQASYHLSKKGLGFLTDEDVLSPDEFKKIGNENFEIAEFWTDRLEEMLRQHNPFVAEKSFYPFRWHFLRLKILLDAVRIRKIILDRLIEREKPETLFASQFSSPEEISDGNLFFNAKDSLYGLLAMMNAKERNLEFKPLKKIGTDNVHKNYFPTPYLKRIKNKLALFLSISFPGKKNGGSILVGNLNYDIELFMRKVSHKYKFYFYRQPSNIILLNTLLAEKVKFPDTAKNFDLKDRFKYEKVTEDALVDEVLGRRVQGFAEKYIPFLWKGLQHLEEVDRKRNFLAFIHHTGSSDAFAGLAISYFNTRAKPVIIVQHGAYGIAPNRTTEYCEFSTSAYFLAWGEGIKKVYEGLKSKDCRIVSTGSGLIDKIKARSRRSQKISRVCYVPGLYRGYTAYYPNGQPCLDAKMFLMETGFLSILKPYLDKYDFTYKVAPAAARYSPLFGNNPMPKWVKENLKGIKIESRPLLSVINKFDLFIIDFPTTVLVQTAATFAEILVYIGNSYHAPSAEVIEILKKRAIVSYSEDDFKRKIISVLERGYTTPLVEDESFLKEFGTYVNDGKSINRMTDCISEIINFKQN